MVQSTGLEAPVLFLRRFCKPALPDLKFFQNHRPQLRDAARSECENHVAYLARQRRPLSPLRRRTQRSDVMVSSLMNPLGQNLSGSYSFDWRFTRGINVENEQTVGIVERMHKLVHERLRAGVTMRLEDDVNFAETALPRRREGGANLGRMMPVVVDHADSVNRASQLEATIHAAKVLKGCADLLDADVKTDANRNRRCGIQHVVHAGHVQTKFA